MRFKREGAANQTRGGGGAAPLARLFSVGNGEPEARQSHVMMAQAAAAAGVCITSALGRAPTSPGLWRGAST